MSSGPGRPPDDEAQIAARVGVQRPQPLRSTLAAHLSPRGRIRTVSLAGGGRSTVNWRAAYRLLTQLGCDSEGGLVHGHSLGRWLEDRIGTTMKRGIFTLTHLDAWKTSTTHTELLAFVGKLCEASKGRALDGPDVAAAALEASSCRPVKGLVDCLSVLQEAVEAFPPTAGAGSRFGNEAFRQWHAHAMGRAGELAGAIVGPGREAEAAQVAALLAGSFGNATRIDFGTGHEAAFVMLMHCLAKAGTITTTVDKDGADSGSGHLVMLALVVVPAYLDLVDLLITTYKLEPAGTHGAWSLDDYHFLPFLLGAAQLEGHASLHPATMRTAAAVDEVKSSYLYPRALAFVLGQKSSVPMDQGAPVLYDISFLPSWETITKGLVSMYADEVLGRFPVAQHFVFGALFPATWELPEAVPPPLSGRALLSMQPARSAATDADPFLKHFGRPRRGPHRVAGGRATPPVMGRPGIVPTTTLSGAAFAFPAQLDGSNSHSLLGGNEGITIHGWTLRAAKSHLSDAAALDALAADGCDFTLPEMVFGANRLRLSHLSSGLEIELNARDALMRCRLDADVHDRTPVTVPIAPKWAARKAGAPIQQLERNHDWTYTTDYGGTFWRHGHREEPSAATPGASIDYDMLRRRDPILWFEQVDLFESELDDFGTASLSAKVRVMPGCFFVLLRFWMRVDGVVARVWDTRIFHAFDQPAIIIERTRREMAFAPLLAAVESAMDEGENARSLLNQPHNFVEHMPIVSFSTLICRL